MVAFIFYNIRTTICVCEWTPHIFMIIEIINIIEQTCPLLHIASLKARLDTAGITHSGGMLFVGHSAGSWDQPTGLAGALPSD